MISAKQFLSDFVRAIITAEPMERKALIAEWVKRLEAREKDLKGNTAYEDIVEAAKVLSDAGIPNEPPRTLSIDISGLRMSGREWYQRFRDELRIDADFKQAVEAAKKAAGIEDEH